MSDALRQTVKLEQVRTAYARERDQLSAENIRNCQLIDQLRAEVERLRAVLTKHGIVAVSR